MQRSKNENKYVLSQLLQTAGMMNFEQHKINGSTQLELLSCGTKRLQSLGQHV